MWKRCENRKTHIPQIFEIRQYDQWTPKYDFLYENNTFPMSSIIGLTDFNKYTMDASSRTRAGSLQSLIKLIYDRSINSQYSIYKSIVSRTIKYIFSVRNVRKVLIIEMQAYFWAYRDNQNQY